MDIKITKTSIIYALFFLLILFCCFQNVIIYNFNGQFSFKMSHFISLLFLPFLLSERKIKIPPTILNLFFMFVIFVSLTIGLKYSINNLILNYISGFYYLVLFLTLGCRFGEKTWLKMIKTISWIVITFILIKLVINIDVIISFLRNPYNHPVIETFFGGGVNLEATWVALLGFSFYKDKKGYLYWLLSLIISSIYASRVGIMASCFLFIYLYFSNKKTNLKAFLKTLFSVVFIGIIGLIILNKLGMYDYLLERFLNIGSESGSLGRLRMWNYVFESFKNNPFGYGIGNSLVAIELSSGLYFTENNLHNLFLQMLLELGIVGFLFYMILIIYFVIKNRAKLLSDPIISFIFIYIVLSLFQFRGGDSLLFCFLGLYLIRISRRRELEKKL